ncbi:MAG TPA: cation:proton antiporter [Anaerolineae bacterium]|jgi:Kef-type K+ transport system membrane component KefB|nr:cation:proton antiporter [Anaerolineae bacterium]
MSQEFLDFLIALVIVIFAAKMGGYISTRFRQPSVLGELLVGLILGPTILNMLFSWPIFHEPELLEEALTLMAELGVIMLMFLAGLELHLSELLSSGKVAVLAGVLGVLVPLGMGYGTAILFGVDSSEALFIALTLSATSVSISAQTLMELGVLRSRVGLGLLGSAVFDDILVILLLSVSFLLISGSEAGGLTGVLKTLLGMGAYLIVATLAGLYLLPRLAILAERLPVSQGIIAFALIVTLFYAWAAEVIGSMAAITGAFMVGLFLARTPFKERIERGVATMAYGFFVPIFFVNIGLAVNMREVGDSALLFAVAITLVAVASKIIGSGLGGLLGGFTRREALQLGIGMVSRGEVGLIVAAFALSEGLLSTGNFSIVVFMIIVATLITPLMLRAVFSRPVSLERAGPGVS